MPTVLISGANRGIGLALVKQYQTKGFSVIAACRKASPELLNTEAKVIDGIDVGDVDSIAKLHSELLGIKLDIVINNAGIFSQESLGSINYDAIVKQLEINAIAPLRISEAVKDNIVAGGKIALITSRMGSMDDNGSGSFYGYRMSKAALNAAGVSLARDLAASGIAVAILHPGFVKTEMVDNAGDISPDLAAQGLCDRIEELSLDTSGTFWHANGDILPW